MLVQHLRHPLERIDVRPGFWGLEWSCPSPWEVPEGIQKPFPTGSHVYFPSFRFADPIGSMGLVQLP